MILVHFSTETSACACKCRRVPWYLQHVQMNLFFLYWYQSEIPLPSDDISFFLLERGTSESSTYGKQRICLSNSWSEHFHVSWPSDFIFYQKPLYKSLHQSFFYSFITILPSESGVTLHYSTILPCIPLFRHLTSIFESTNVISRY